MEKRCRMQNNESTNYELINKKANELFFNYFGKPEGLARIIIDEIRKKSDELTLFGIEPEKLLKEFGSYNYAMNSKIDFEKQVELVTLFYGSINVEYVRYLKDVLYNPENKVIFGKNAGVNVQGNRIELTNFGDIRDVYSMVHEFSHILDLKNGENETRAIFSETNAQTMERIFDNFLRSLSVEQLNHFNLNKQQIYQDIDNGIISTFFDRYRLTMDVMKNPNDAVARRYMLAQLYSSRISSLPFEEQKNMIESLIESIRNNDFEKAKESLVLDLSNVNENKKEDISTLMNQIVQLIKKNYEKKITTTNDIENIFFEILQTSKLSSYDSFIKYSESVDFLKNIKYRLEHKQGIDSIIEKVKMGNPNIEPVELYKKCVIEFLNPVVNKIKEEYGDKIPQDRMARLINMLSENNIEFRFDPSYNDIQADSYSGKLIINPQKTFGENLEEKITSTLGASIHESFHMLVNILKTPDEAEKSGERLMYKVATTEGDRLVHFAPGKYGQVLSEGFVEKLSSEFASRNGFYYTLNPNYIPYVKLCGELQKQDEHIDDEFLFRANIDDLVERMDNNLKEKYQETERLAVINNFAPKEVKRDENLVNLNSDNVKESWMEQNGEETKKAINDSFQEPLDIKRTDLNGERNLNIAKVKKLVNTPQNNQINSNGTINILFIVTIIVITVIVTILLFKL